LEFSREALPDLANGVALRSGIVFGRDARQQAFNSIQVFVNGIRGLVAHDIKLSVKLLAVLILLRILVAPVSLEFLGKGVPSGTIFFLEPEDDTASVGLAPSSEPLDLVLIFSNVKVAAGLAIGFKEFCNVVPFEESREAVLG